MMIVVPDRQAVTRAFARESEHAAELVRGCGDLSQRVPGLAWNVGQLAAHLTAVYFVFAQTLRDEGYRDAGLEQAAAGQTTLPRTIAAANEYAIAIFRAENPEAAADGLAVQAADLLAAFDAQQDLARELPTPWYGPGRTRAVGTIAGLAVSESLVHGRDLARAVGGDTGMSQGSAAAAAPAVMSAMLPLLLDTGKAKEFRGTFELRVRGGSNFAVQIADGTAECFEAGEHRADCVISLDPRTALLLGFGRLSLPRAVLSGGTLAYGRKPWLGLRFPELFEKA